LNLIQNPVTLIHGDCLDVMKNIPDKSIDLILTDLPYGVTACKWDSVIDIEHMWTQYKRIIMDDGNIVLTATQPFSSHLVMSNPEWFKYEWIWENPQGMNPLLAKHQPMKNHEQILVFSKKRGRYFPQMEKGDPYKSFMAQDDATIGEVYGSGKSQHKENNGIRYPKSIKKFKQDRKGFHPTQKPLELMKYLIKTYTLEQQTVLDSTMGSGTTGLACKHLNRKFIGIELDETYFNTAKERIQNK